MSIEKLHKIVGWCCIGLSPIGFIVGGLDYSQEQTEKGAKILFFLLGAYLPFWCFYCIKIGHTVFLFQWGSEPIYKEKEPYLFWPAMAVVFFGSVALIVAPFK